MSKGKLFDYAVVYHPKPKKDQSGNEIPQQSELIVPVTQVLAVSQDVVGMMAVKKIPDNYMDRLEDIEVVIRPF